MIKVDFEKNLDKYTFKVEGHAEKYKEKELICSASSILVYTLFDMLTELDTCGSIENLYTDLEKGSAYFEFEADSSDVDEYGTPEAETVLFTAIRGFELLEKQYPKAVSVFLK